MHDFDYRAPDNLEELLALKSMHAADSSLLAGGTDLIVFMRGGRKRPSLVIDSKQIPELTELRLEDSRLVLGAAVSCRRIYEHPGIVQNYPALVESTSLIGGIQIQGRATVGGNLCNAAPSADTVPALIVYGATAHISGANGSREVPVEKFCLAPGRNCLNADEILVNIVMPLPPARSGACFLRFIPRNEMDIAVANAAAYVELDESEDIIKAARVAIGAVAPVPLLVEEAGASLAGQAATEEVIARAAKIARAAAKPIADMRGTVEHRLQLVEVLTARALREAVERARGGGV